MELIILAILILTIPIGYTILEIIELRKEIQMLLEITDKHARMCDIIDREVRILNKKCDLLKEEINERFKQD